MQESLQNSKDVADLKAVSQNLMQSNLSITDGLYGMFSVDDVGKRIANLGRQTQISNISSTELAEELLQLVNRLRTS